MFIFVATKTDAKLQNVSGNVCATKELDCKKLSLTNYNKNGEAENQIE